jgi:rhodanese-related sulfurtransferase
MDRYLEFAANHTVLVAALLFSFFLLVFSEIRRKASGLVNVEPQDAVKLINNDAVVLDLRSPEAFAKGHIVNARNIPFDDLDPSSEKISGLHKKPIIAVCDSGMVSTRAVTKLRKSGFESVYGLKGGIAGWTQASLPLVTGKKTRRKS